MKTLEKEILKNTFIYCLIERNLNIAIYSQYCLEWSETVPYAYEVFIIKQQKERYFNERHFPLMEKFPSNGDFGRTAWSYRSFQKAYQKFEELTISIKKIVKFSYKPNPPPR